MLRGLGISRGWLFRRRSMGRGVGFVSRLIVIKL